MTEKDAAAPTQTDPPVPPDPIYQKSYAIHMAVASIALVGSVALAIADEMFFRREYKGIQRQHKEVYSVYLKDLLAKRGGYEAAVKSLDEFRDLDLALRKKQDELFETRVNLQDEFAQLDSEGAALSEALKDPNSKIAALTYQIEHHAHDEHAPNGMQAQSAQHLRDEIQKVKSDKITYKWKKPVRKNQTLERWSADDAPAPKLIGEPKPLEYSQEPAEASGTIAELQARFQAIVERKAALQDTIGKTLQPESQARRARDLWLRTNMGDIASFIDSDSDAPNAGEARDAIKAKITQVGATRYLRDYATTLDYATIESIHETVSQKPFGGALLSGDINQIHIKEANNWVDRCETCHVGTREPLPITKDALSDALSRAGWSQSKIEAQPLDLFTTHPRAAELFAHHDPEKVGCSTCHNGNGVAVNGLEQAHGLNKHWLFPLFPKENLEAGCIQCHQSDFHLDTGPQFSAARETFLEKGCWGCHSYKGHDAEPEQLNKLSARQRDIQRDIDLKTQQSKQIGSLGKSFDQNDPARHAANQAEQESLNFEVAKLRTEAMGVGRQLAMRWQERIKVGPNLKDARAKLRPEILFDWVKDPSSVRPLTKMPTFRWDNDEEVKDVVAFLWQSALWTTENPWTKRSYPEYGALRLPPGGDAANGRALFMGDAQRPGGLGCLSCHSIQDDQTNQSVGSTRATDLTNLGDKNNAAYVFRWISDPKHRIVAYSAKDKRDLPAAEAAAADPSTLVTAQATIMPDFRLSEAEARDIATYLTSRKSGKWTTAPDWISDTSRFERGKKLVLYQGCAGCHEIAGLEDEKGIGRDLTIEGSQALDRLDFGHLMIEAQRGHDPLAEAGWKTQKDGVEIFKDGGASLEPRAEKEHKSWFRPRGFFMHKLAKPDLYDTAKFLPDRFGRLRMPQFRWSAAEIHDLTTFLLGSVVPAVPETSRYNPGEEGQAIREGWWIVKKYNCHGCHQLTPGTTPDFWKLPAFAAMDTSLPATRDLVLPPTLDGAGFRMRPEYIASFLRDPSLDGGREAPKSTRKHLTARMPTFHLSDDEIGKLVRFFAAMAKQPSVYQPEKVDALTPAENQIGADIFMDACATCHPTHQDGKVMMSAETKAPDLLYSGRKLRPEWLRPWLRLPASLVPTTSMPPNFEEVPAEHRWVRFTDATKFPRIPTYQGDHLDLMVRYLLTDYARDPK